jgi:3-oxoacyl-[acyl-carrier protein] reductase
VQTNKPVLLITGVSGGLGRIAAEHFLSKDFIVVGCSRTKINIEHENFFHVQLDLNEKNAVSELISNVHKQFKKIDFLINAIGVSHSKLAYFTSDSEIQDVFQMNTLLPFRVIKECSKVMSKKGGGKIINLSSIHVAHSTPGTALYSSSKIALEQMTKVLASELLGSQIFLNCLRLSAVENAGMTNTLTPESKTQLIGRTIYKREVKVSEFTGAVHFLLSKESEGLCGQIISLGDL